MIRNNHLSSLICHKFKRTGYYLIIFISLLTVYCSIFITYCFAQEKVIITSDTLEYSKKTSTYIAKGNVTIQKEDAIIKADEIIYNEQTSDITAIGSVSYSDTETWITAGRAEINLDTKTGILYDAEILFRKEDYRISGSEIEKKSEGYYFSPDAMFTTCKGPKPEWCFKGRDVNLIVGKELRAKHVSFRIKDIPLLYTPYLRVPILTERKTGFLMPSLGYSNSRGGSIRVPFFWAISQNRDATIILDTYSKRGIGEGIEYRYIERQNTYGKLWVYHIGDSSLDKDFFELRVNHEQRNPKGLGGYLNINYVNEEEFFREFELDIDVRTNRFLESTGEITLPLKNSRIYLLSQYWIDLKKDSKPAPNRLPEVGFVLHPKRVGDIWISGEATLSNFWRDEGVYGQRVDVYPKLIYSFGSDIVVMQSLGLRGTAYALQRGEDDFFHKEALEYSIVAHTRLFKRYKGFTHIVEPSLGYHLITDSDEPPLFDSTELFQKTSRIEFSMLNRFIDEEGEYMVIRASQAYDSYYGDRGFLPFRLELGIKRPLSLRLGASYDVHSGELESINSDLSMVIAKTTILVGQTYNRSDDIHTYILGLGLRPFKSLQLWGRVWYDVKKSETRDIYVNMRYMRQCWGINMGFYKRPGDFTAVVMFELKGIIEEFKI